jgi:RNA polymerase sigma factor (sigma-70 family)
VTAETHAQTEERLTALTQERARWLAFLRTRLSSDAEAEDILHDSLLRAMDRVGDVRREEDLFAWFYRVLRHATIDAYRREAARRNRDERLATEAAAAHDAGPQTKDLHEKLCGCFRSRLSELPPRYARLLETVDLGGATPAEVAARDEASLNTINVTLHRARKALRRELIRFCGACAEQACLDCACEPPADPPAGPAKKTFPEV